MTSIATAHALHIGGRDEQQDAATVLQSGKEVLLVLADGMGGHAGGQLASNAVVATAERLWQADADRSDPGAFLVRVFEEAHAEINRVGEERGISPRSTGVLVHIRDGKATWTHIGDSRLYRFRGNELLGRTHDHSVVQMLRDMGKITEEEMGNHPDQNRLTHSLGGETDPEPEIESADVQPGDAFVLCSDGLWEMITPAEMAEAAAGNLKERAGVLAADANQRAGAGSDNISIVFARVDEASAAAATPAAGKSARDAKKSGKTTVLAFLLVTVIATGAVAGIFQPWKSSTGDDGSAAGKSAPAVIPTTRSPAREGEKKAAKPDKQTDSLPEKKTVLPPAKKKPDTGDTPKPKAKADPLGKPDVKTPDVKTPDGKKPDRQGTEGKEKADPTRKGDPDKKTDDTRRQSKEIDGALDGDTKKPGAKPDVKPETKTNPDSGEKPKKKPDQKRPDEKKPDQTKLDLNKPGEKKSDDGADSTDIQGGAGEKQGSSDDTGASPEVRPNNATKQKPDGGGAKTD